MVKVIMGLKGTGKTKRLLELAHEALENDHGNVIVIERGPKLRYDLSYKARLIEAGDYDFDGYDFFKGFISGLHACNYDITDVFVDSLYSVVGSDSVAEVERFFGWLDAFSEKENIRFTVMISADAETAPEGIKKFF